MERRKMNLRRRQVILGTTAVTGMALSQATWSRPYELLDSHDPRDFALLSRKIKYRMDDGLVFAWIFGTKYAQVASELRPLMHMQSGSIYRVRNRADGFEVTAFERTFYVDLETRKPLTKWRNPLTGENITIQRGPVGPTTMRFAADGSQELPSHIGGAPFNGDSRMRLLACVGDDLWISNDATVRLARDGGKAGIFDITEWAMSHASLSEASDPERSAVEARIHLQEVTSFPVWMKMGSQPGVVTSRGVGRKVHEFESMPRTWLKMLRDFHPEVSRDPNAAFEFSAAQFEQ